MSAGAGRRSGCCCRSWPCRRRPAPARRPPRSACSTCSACTSRPASATSRLRPTLAVVDPLLTLSQPAGVTAASGLDIACHALESWTARWYATYDAKRPEQRVPYCGANPISDAWAERALTLLATSFREAVQDGQDLRAREQMALAATFAGLGFGNAGVHLPHANAYPIAGRVRDFRPAGYPADEPLVPHGMAVALTAPAAFRFTYAADPERHPRRRPDARPDRHGRGPGGPRPTCCWR
ncbi:MAG: iron-containing alcohol dehydrogenase [Nocardioides sp.]